MKSKKWMYLTFTSLAAVTTLLPEAEAQDAPLAPVEQIHLRGESRGDGGGYPTSVPLDLPGERGGLPVPVSLVYGGMAMGAAGRGWDVPLSFIRENRSLAHRRPTAGAAGAAPSVPLQVELTLMGGSMKMVPEGTGYVPQRGTLSLRAEKSGDTWKAYDGEGRTYTFVRPTNAAGNTLLSDMWLLEKIEGTGTDSKVELVYDVIPQGISNMFGVSIDLVRVKYNHSSTDKAKHEIALNYGAAQSVPLSFDVSGPDVIMRVRTLTGIEVLSREKLADSDTELKTLRKYKLTYQEDPDTGLSMLQKVSVSGQTGTTQASTELPIARYEYGRATLPATPWAGVAEGGAPAAKLEFGGSVSVAPPAAVPNPGITGLARTSHNGGGDSRDTKNTTTIALEDVTGDGRADIVFRKIDPITGLHSYKRVAQTPGSNGVPDFSGADTAFEGGGLLAGQAGAGVQTTRYHTVSFPDELSPSTYSHTDTWRALRDVNGDGRADYIVANELENKWVVYVNKPNSTDPNLADWVRQEHSVTDLIDTLVARGHAIEGAWTTGQMHLPLKRVSAGDNYDNLHCQELVSGSWTPVPLSDCGRTNANERRGQVNGTAWDLLDFNGDTALDLVFSDPLILKKFDNITYDEPIGNYRLGRRAWRRMESKPGGISSDIRVVFGQYTVGLVPSTDPLVIDVDAWAGVAASYDASPYAMEDYYGLRDVNGDGLIDYFKDDEAWLGNGQEFTSARLAIPDWSNRHGPHKLGGTYSSPKYCDNSWVSSKIESGLYDITGDGIPDFWRGYNDGTSWQSLVYVGTGTGFRLPMATNFHLASKTDAKCDGTAMFGMLGLHDLDGDGRQEYVTYDSATSKLQVARLVGSDGLRALSAGKLTAIENGHGERTEITYASAKDDNTTLHQIPSPEIVVAKVKKLRSDKAVTETTYAYGNPLFRFDPLENRFRSLGYGRTVAVTATDSEGRIPGVGEARATITDRASFAVDTRSETLRMLSVLRGGVVNTVTELAGVLPVANQLLTVNVTTDSRRILATTYGAHARVSTGGGADAACLFVDEPYSGQTFSALNTCRARGFAYTESEYGVRSSQLSSDSDDNVRFGSKVIAIDDYGRVTKRHVDNDTRTGTDDVCVTTAYATSSTVVPRVLSAVSAVTVGTSSSTAQCVNSSPRSVVRYEYDGLPQGQVSNGRRTGQEAERRNTVTGALLDDAAVRLFDATYDTRGRLTTLTSTDGNRTRTISKTVADPFDLVLTKTQTTATGATNQVEQVTLDPVTMLPLSVTDANGLVTSTRYDGFGRNVMSLIKAPGKTEGALSYTEYLGFEGGDALGRRVVETSFANPVDPDTVDTAVGTTVTSFLDEAGRVTTRIADLGSDYTDDLVLSAIVYDELGRVAFEADPFPDSQDATTAYGTTYFYNTDGTLECSVRGSGPQDYSVAKNVNHAKEIYPTCYRHWFDAGAEWVGVTKSDGLDYDESTGKGAPQRDVEYRAQLSAIGRVVERQTWQWGTQLEGSTFSYDLMGNLRSHARKKLEGTNEWVESSFVYDSFGQLLSVSEDATQTRSYDYSGWGELTEVATPGDATSGLPARSQIMQYDGLGRLVLRQEYNDDVLDSATVNTYTYDTGESIHAGQPATYTLGRLASATSPTSEVYFGYDALGRMIAKATKDPQGEIYVETMSQDADGALTELGMRLPDASHALEKVTYAYDSARRLTGATHTEGTANTSLYSTESIDAFGRVTRGNVGVAGVAAVHATTGRRLPTSFAVAAPNGDTRTIAYKSYDAIGRELSREEQTNGATAITYSSEYDALGRLSKAEVSTGKSQAFGYDSLGNILSIDSSNNANDRYLSYRSDNRDRLCAISSAPLSVTDPCNVVHDALGNIVEQPTAGTRTLSFYGSGAVKQVSESGATANFRYDAFGAVQELDITGAGADTRHDRRYGLVEKRETAQGSMLTRTFPIGGMTASRRGHSSDWVFAIGEARGNRFFVDEQGNFVQDTIYDGYGRPSPVGATPSDKNYSREQWNGGDFLATFSLSHLGARLYDPVIGRFLSPDPLMLMNTASNSNPYAFAYNDPINFGDPSGMCPGCGIWGSYGGSGGSSGGTYNDSLGDFYEWNSSPAGGRPHQGGAWTDRSPLLHPEGRPAKELPHSRRTALSDPYWRGYISGIDSGEKENGVIFTISKTVADSEIVETVADTAGHDSTDMGEWTFKEMARRIALKSPAPGRISVRKPEKLSGSRTRPGFYRNPVTEHSNAVKTWKTGGTILGWVGLVGDVADAGKAIARAYVDPTYENIDKVVLTGAKIYLMSKGPVGWGAAYGLEKIYPYWHAGAKEVHKLDSELGYMPFRMKHRR